MTQKLTLLRGVQAINWNRIEDDKDLEVWDRLTGMLATRFRAVEARPSGEDAVLGPLISARQMARVQAYIDATTAPLIARGTVAPDVPAGGFYIAPALFGPVDPQSPLAQDEVFGPVLAAIPLLGMGVCLGLLFKALRERG